MNPLTEVLRCLKYKSKSWNIIIYPDPRRFLASTNSRGKDGLRNFRVRLKGDLNLDEYLVRNPVPGGSTNIGSRTVKRYTSSRWVRIPEGNLKNDNGQNLREVLIDILDEFPQYDLQSKKGYQEAIRDIESKINSVAQSVEYSKAPPEF